MLVSTDSELVRAQEAVLQSFDFIQAYATYADILEAPRIMHEVVAMQLLATVLNQGGVSIGLGGIPLPLDLWVVLLSGSGFGRSTLLGLTQPILRAAGLEGMEYSVAWGSPQAVYQQLAEHPSGLFVWGELSEKLRQLKLPLFTGIKQWLTDRYDNWRTPDQVVYRATGRREDTPPITFVRAPRVNILATSSEEWFFNDLLTEDSTGGFLPRWLLIRAPTSKRIIPIPTTPDNTLVQPLAERLQRASELEGVADLTRIQRSYARWYAKTKQRFSSQPNRALADAYFNRHRGHVLKIALVYEVSSSLSLCISMRSWARAVKFAACLEEMIFSLLATGMSGSGHRMNQMVELVRSAGGEGLSRSEFTRVFQHMDPRERNDMLITLHASETIFAFIRQTPGRPALIMVHRDFVDGYKTQHPSDHPPPTRIR